MALDRTDISEERIASIIIIIIIIIIISDLGTMLAVNIN
jgi:flagellar basal body-associated protein FliL